MSDADEDYDKDYVYDLVIMITHPTIDPAVITGVLGLEPRGGWRVGEQRLGPSGLPMNGIARQSYWHRRERIERDRHFFEGINDLLDSLFIPHATFIRTLIAEGGTVNIVAQIPGARNIGSKLELETMVKLLDVGITIDVEVFPHMR